MSLNRPLIASADFVFAKLNTPIRWFTDSLSALDTDCLATSCCTCFADLPTAVAMEFINFFVSLSKNISPNPSFWFAYVIPTVPPNAAMAASCLVAPERSIESYTSMFEIIDIYANEPYFASSLFEPILSYSFISSLGDL